MNKLLILSIIVGGVCFSDAQVLFDNSTAGFGLAIADQVFPDAPTFSTYIASDTVAENWTINKVTAWFSRTGTSNWSSTSITQASLTVLHEANGFPNGSAGNMGTVAVQLTAVLNNGVASWQVSTVSQLGRHWRYLGGLNSNRRLSRRWSGISPTGYGSFSI